MKQNGEAGCRSQTLLPCHFRGHAPPLWAGGSHSSKVLGHSPSQATQWSFPGSSLPRADLQQLGTATSCPRLLQAELTCIVAAGTTRMGKEWEGLDASGASEFFLQLFPSLLWDVSLPSFLHPCPHICTLFHVTLSFYLLNGHNFFPASWQWSQPQNLLWPIQWCGSQRVQLWA